MSNIDNLPKPNTKHLTTIELEELEKKIDFFIEQNNDTELLKLSKVYPLSAIQLNDFKHHFGMDFILKNQLNLVEAIKAYGDSWVES